MKYAMKIADLGVRPTERRLEGQYLKSFDHNANNGHGYGEFTFDIDEAMKFDNTKELLEFWRRPSSFRPIREDGKPNRPLTSTSIELERIE